MANFKCKFCGSDMVLPEGQSTIRCAACSSHQTVPAVCDQPLLARFVRANRLRLACEFDKAAGIYESITADFPEEPEGYWGLVLCKYGITYRDDSATGKKAPVCNRASFDCVLDDGNYEQALENADPAARRVYREEAKQIETLRRALLAIAEKESAYDIFLCCVEMDEAGNRTEGFQLALAVARRLMEMGYKVFFPRIGLSSIHPAAEPHMFAALHSASVMLVFGTDYEHFDAVWVKNQWSRFLRLTAGDKHLIPCFKGIDAFDMPREFAKLPGLDMGTPGAEEQLLERIEQLLKREKAPAMEEPAMEEPAMEESAAEVPVVEAPVEEAPAVPAEDPRESIYIRANAMMKAAREAAYREAAKLFDSIEDFKDAAALAESCRAAVAQIRQKEEYARKDVIYQQALALLRCAKVEEDYLHAAEGFESVPDHLDAAALGQQCRQQAELARKDAAYQQAFDKLQSVKTPKGYRQAAELFDLVSDHRDAADLSQQCREKAAALEKDAIYTDAKNRMAGTQLASWQEALKRLEPIADWKDSAALMDTCREKIAELEARQDAQKKEAAASAKSRKIFLPIAAAVLAVAAAVVFVIVPLLRYNAAVALMEEGKYEEAIAAFEAMDGYRDSEEKIKECSTGILENQYQAALALMNEGRYEEAIAVFKALGTYKDSAEQIPECHYLHAAQLAEKGNFLEAEKIYIGLDDYKDSAAKAVECRRSYYDLELDNMVKRGDISEAAMFYYSIGETETALEIWDRVNSRKTLEAGVYHTVGLVTNGTVVAAGSNYDGRCNPIHPGQCDVSGWRNIISVVAGYHHTVGLTKDHTVVATGLNTDGQCNVSEWTDIVDIATGYEFTVGLKADGTVVYAGNGEDVDDTKQWENIMAIDAGRDFVVGLKTDGTIVCTRNYSINPTNVIAIAASDFGLTCLSEDGTVTSTFKKLGGLKNVARIYSGSYAAIAIMSSGEIVIDGDLVESSYMHLSQWDLLKSGALLAFSSNARHAVILQPWGNIRSYGESGWSRLNVQHWHDIEVPRQ